MDDSLKKSAEYRSITTCDSDELERFQPGKNREYTQLQAGVFQAKYREIFLGDVHLFRESLGIGSRIEATPDSKFVPFGLVLPASGEYHFCGTENTKGAFVQASGGEWDLVFKDQIDFIGAVFERDFFCSGYEHLRGVSPGGDVFQSLSLSLPSSAILAYQKGITALFRQVTSIPGELFSHDLKRLSCNEALQLTIGLLSEGNDRYLPLAKMSKRAKGVGCAVDYLSAHATSLPDIQTLCDISGLSERSLQYGFKEYAGLTPIQYVRVVRLNGVRKALLNADPYVAKVSDIALAWGFVEFGRFAKEYRELFYELPSDTLRK